jgi:hypothetical protein
MDQRKTHNMPEQAQQTKTCRTCDKPRPLTDFELPKHRECMECKLKRRKLALFYQTHTLPEPETALTTTGEGWNRYRRDRNRAKRAVELANQGVVPKPVDPFKMDIPRKCRRCHRMLARRLFASEHVRLCLECDGPA